MSKGQYSYFPFKYQKEVIIVSTHCLEFYVKLGKLSPTFGHKNILMPHTEFHS